MIDILWPLTVDVLQQKKQPEEQFALNGEQKILQPTFIIFTRTKYDGTAKVR